MTCSHINKLVVKNYSLLGVGVCGWTPFVKFDTIMLTLVTERIPKL